MAGDEEVAPGATFGDYRILRELGEGAVGVVFLAEPSGGGAPVALKLLKRRLSGDEVFRRRFLHEARAAREVHNNHLVSVVDAGEAEGRHFLAMRYVPGVSLEERIEGEGPLPIDDVLRLAAEIGSGLDALHRVGLIHRDVKPSNIVFDESGAALLTDFGMAKGPAYTVLTRPGQVIGTLDYTAPELIRGREAGPAADLYSFGCVVFECLAGEPPFGSKSMFQVGAAHLEEDPPDPCASRSDAPAELSWAVRQALAKEVGDRPPTATAYARLLRSAAGRALR